MLRKPLDRVYFEDKYAIPEDNKVILAKDGIIENYDYLNEYDRLIQFITSNDMSLESNYEQLQLPNGCTKLSGLSVCQYVYCQY